MAAREKSRVSWEFSWKRTRILIGAVLCAVMIWRVVVLPQLRYLERNTDWFSAGIFKGNGYYSVHLDFMGVLFGLAGLACVLASASTEREHRTNPFFVIGFVWTGIFLNFTFSPLARLNFALGVALSLVPVVFVASCIVIRDVHNKLNWGIFGVFFVLLVGTFHYHPAEKVNKRRLVYAMAKAVRVVNFSHYQADIIPVRTYEEALLSLAAAPGLRELGGWQMQLSGGEQPWGGLLDSGSSEDFLDFAYQMMREAEKVWAEVEEVAAELSAEGQWQHEWRRTRWLVNRAEEGMMQSAYLVTDRQIVRCLTRLKTEVEKRKGLVFVDGYPIPDIELDQTLLHCFDGENLYRFEEGAPVEVLSAPCLPLHGFGAYSLERSDALLAASVRLWAADLEEMAEIYRHIRSLRLVKKEDIKKTQLAFYMAQSQEKDDEKKMVMRIAAASLLAALANEYEEEKEGSAEKAAFVESFFAAYAKRALEDDEEVVREHDAECLEQRARWYESDPQVEVLARRALASESVAGKGHTALNQVLGLVGRQQADTVIKWSRASFELRKVWLEEKLIDGASARFGTILDTFVSTRHRQAENEMVGRLFAEGTDNALRLLGEEGIEHTRYFLGSKHNGWCRYQMVLRPDVSDGANGGQEGGGSVVALSLRGALQMCRVDDALLSFDEKGEVARRWDATGFPFHAPVVVGQVERWSQLSEAHQAQRARDDERDGLLRLFLEQLMGGALADVGMENLDLHPGVKLLTDGQRAAMERMGME